MSNFLTINRTYADNDVLYAADLNNLCNSIMTFLNVTKLNADNLNSTVLTFVTFSGMIAMFGKDTAPTGWLECDGSVVSQTTYAALYSVISTTYNTGGEGAGNFRLPDYRRRTTVGMGGAGSGVLGNSLGNAGGEETHTLASDKSTITTHYHFDSTGHAHFQQGTSIIGAMGVSDFVVGAGGGANTVQNAISTSAANPVYNSVGGGGAHTNMQPSLVMLFMIKA